MYNGIINNQGDNMDNETKQILKQLEAEHKKAMEGINAFNKSMHEAIDTTKDYIGVAK